MATSHRAAHRAAHRATLAGSLRRWFRHDIERPLEQLAGGPARLKVILMLACVLALDASDKATVGAVAAQVESALRIGNVQIGWLVTASTAVAALVTLPLGVLVDRVHRVRLLVAALLVWSVAMLISGLSVSYPMLLLSRLALGVGVSAASPAVTSMTGDFFRPGERGRIFGYVLAGELLGVAFGFLISGNLAAAFSWRVSFWVLGALGLLLTGVIWRYLPEPARGGQSCIPLGAEHVPATGDTPADACRPRAGDGAKGAAAGSAAAQPGKGRAPVIERKIAQQEIEPHSAQVLQGQPSAMPIMQAARYILSVRTNRTLILASALGYFYFTGVRTFAIVFMRGRFALGQATASTMSVALGLGAIVGVLLAGRIGDGLIGRGRLTGRVLVGAIAYLLATAAFLPALLLPSLLAAAPFFFLAAAGIGGANPAVDAARLDVMPSGLWGRAEGVRATFRFALEAIAPPVFGYVAAWFGGGAGSLASAAAGEGSKAAGLDMAFLVLLAPLGLAGLLLLLRGTRTYPRDVATAIASEQAVRADSSPRD